MRSPLRHSCSRRRWCPPRRKRRRPHRRPRPRPRSHRRRPAAPSRRSASRARNASSPRPCAPISRWQPGDAFDSDRLDKSLKALVRHRPVHRRDAPARGQRAGRPRGREPGHQPHRLRGQQEAQGRNAAAEIQLKPRTVYTRQKVQSDVARHPRPLPPQRPLRRDGRAQDHPATAKPGRSGVRDQRGRFHRREAASPSSAITASIPTPCAT